MGVEPKIVVFTPKMDGENNGSKPSEQMDDLEGKTPYFWFNTHIFEYPWQIYIGPRPLYVEYPIV